MVGKHLTIADQITQKIVSYNNVSHSNEVIDQETIKNITQFTSTVPSQETMRLQIQSLQKNLTKLNNNFNRAIEEIKASVTQIELIRPLQNTLKSSDSIAQSMMLIFENGK